MTYDDDDIPMMAKIGQAILFVLTIAGFLGLVFWALVLGVPGPLGG